MRMLRYRIRFLQWKLDWLYAEGLRKVWAEIEQERKA